MAVGLWTKRLRVAVKRCRHSDGSAASTIQVHLPGNDFSSEAVVSDTAFIDFEAEVTVKQIYAGLSKGRPTVAGLCRDVGLGDITGLSAQTLLNVYDFMADHAPVVTDEPGREVEFKARTHLIDLATVAADAPVPIRRSPLETVQRSRGAKMCLEDIYWGPAFYGTDRTRAVRAEVMAVRSNAGLIESSGLAKVRLTGGQVVALLQAISVELPARGYHRGARRFALTTDHGIVSSIIDVIDLGENSFLLLLPFQSLPVLQHRVAELSDRFAVSADPSFETDSISVFSLAGPQAPYIAQTLSLIHAPSHDAKFWETSFGDDEILVLPVSAYGEVAYTIIVSSNATERVWTQLLISGEPFALRPIGQKATDILRLEYGDMCFFRDIDPQTTVAEIATAGGLSEADIRQRGTETCAGREWRGLERRLVGISSAAEHISVLPGDPILHRGEISGYVTSFAYSPTVGRFIGFAYVSPDQSLGFTSTLALDTNGESCEMTITPVPFYDPWQSWAKLRRN